MYSQPSHLKNLSYKDRQILIEILINRSTHLDRMSDAQLKHQITQLLIEKYSRHRLSLAERKNFTKQIFDSIRGFDILQKLLDNPRITEIMVNGPEHIYIEENGRLSLTPLRFEDRNHLVQVICRFFGRAN